MTFTIIETILIVLAITMLVTIVLRFLHLPIILGYLVVGCVVGPHVLAWIPNTNVIKELAEFGVVLLMFTIGLEFSLTKLMALRYAVFCLGSLQVILTIIITMLIGLLMPLTLLESLVIGCVIAMSSTAIVIKQLAEQFELQTKHGFNTIGILLFQDLAVIPILVLMPSLATNSQTTFLIPIAWSLLKGGIAIIIIIAIGRLILKPLFHLITTTRVLELFTLSVLFVAIGAAWLTNAMGISYALGAFLAGIMLGETEFRHQIKLEIRPFRDVLLGLFFVSIGMLVNVSTWLDTWLWIALLLMAIILGKLLLIVTLCLLSNYKLAVATRTGLLLAQGGEFGFAILTLALANDLLPVAYGQVILAALLISFAFAPLIIQYNEKIASFLFPNIMQSSQHTILTNINIQAESLSEHIIICGFGRVGQNVASFLMKNHYHYIALDLDHEIIQKALLAGDNVVYGNATCVDILEAAQLDRAKALVISFDNVDATIAILDQLQRYQPKLPILICCKGAAQYTILCQYTHSV